MDIYSINEGYGLENKQSEIVKKTFYTEKVKECKTSYPLFKKIKRLLKRLPYLR